MNKFGIIETIDNIKVDIFRLGSLRSKIFENFVSESLNEELNFATFKINAIDLIEAQIEYYLSIRNSENPDYGIQWKDRFEKEKMFKDVVVLGKKMNLFTGNEDDIIAFLANIHNNLKSSQLQCKFVNNLKNMNTSNSK